MKTSGLDKKNILVLSILLVTVIFAVSVFATSTAYNNWFLSGGALYNDNVGIVKLNQSFANQQYINTTIRVDLNITVVNATKGEINISYINISSTNTSGWNFTGSLMSLAGTFNASSFGRCTMGGDSTKGVYNSMNCTNGSVAGGTSSIIANGTNATTWFTVPVNFSTEGIYNFVINITAKHSHSVALDSPGPADNLTNTSNFTILADWTTPNLTAYLLSSNNSTSTGNGTITQNAILIWFNVSDMSLNVTNGTNAGRVNITVYNSTNGLIINRTAPDYQSVGLRNLLDQSWNFSYRWNGTDASSIPWNYSVRIEAYDNASNLMNLTEGWFIYDNKSPNASIFDTLLNTSTNPKGAKYVSSLSWINGTASESGKVGYGPVQSCAGIRNVTIAIQSNNSSYWNNASGRWQATLVWTLAENNTSSNYTSGTAPFVNWYVTAPSGLGSNSSNFNYTVIIKVVDNAENNNTNETIMFVYDAVNPIITSFSTNISGADDRIVFMNQSMAFNVVLNDSTLNLSNVNVTLFNATTNTTTDNTYHVPTANHTGNGTGVLEAWNFTVEIGRINVSMGTKEYNFTAKVVAYDNASNSMTSYYSQWFMFDNQSPTITSTNPANNTGVVDVGSAITLYWHEMLNINSVNNTTVRLYATTAGTNVTITVAYTNVSNVGTLTITPSSSLAYNTNYTVNVSHINGSNVIRDLAGNTIPNNYYAFTFKTTAAPDTSTAGGSSTGGGGTSGSVTVGAISAAEPTETVTAATGNIVSISLPTTTATGATTTEAHTVTVVSITGTQVKLKITSTPVYVDVNVGQTKYVDLNGDGANDVKVTVNSVTSDTASITFELITKAKAGVATPETGVTTLPEEQAPTGGEETAPTEGEVITTAAKPVSGTLVLAIMAVIIIAAAGFWWFTQKKGHVTPNYRSL